MSFDFESHAEQLAAEAETLRAERQELAAQVAEIDGRIEQLTTAVNALRGRLPKVTLSHDDDRPRVAQQTYDAIRKALVDHGPEVRQADIGRLAGVSDSSAARALRIMESEGKTEIVRRDRRGGSPIWQLKV